MAIPSRQIGWGTEENLLWQISKQLDNLIKVTYNIGTTTTTTTINPNWVFVSGGTLAFPTNTTGYTLYTGAWTAPDDGQTVDTFPLAGIFYNNDDAGRDTMYLSTNGFLLASDSSYQIDGNQQDLFLTPGNTLLNGDVQNFWYQNTVIGSKWKTSVLVYCGHCCGSPSEETPYSYILNLYSDGTTQFVETRIKSNSDGQTLGTSGPEGPSAVNVSTASQVWSSTDNGVTWTYLGYGTVQ